LTSKSCEREKKKEEKEAEEQTNMLENDVFWLCAKIYGKSSPVNGPLAELNAFQSEGQRQVWLAHRRTL
jgi:hypothetical protein